MIAAGACLIGRGRAAALVPAFLLQAAYLAQHGMILGRLPLLGPHDTLILFAASISLMTLCTGMAPSLKAASGIRSAAGMMSGIVTLAALLFPPLNIPLPQILDTLWFELHVVMAFMAYGLFVVCGLTGVARLAGSGRDLHDILYVTALSGWVFFSVSMITGGIWGYYAWGTYWLWTPKELWTSVLWLYYALLLHLRLKGGYDRLVSLLAAFGIPVMLFTYLGVSMLMKSSHSF